MRKQKTWVMENNRMPPHWLRCIKALRHNRDAIAPFSLREARQHFGVGTDFIRALQGLGLIQWFVSKGRKLPFLTASPSAAQIREHKAWDNARRKAAAEQPSQERRDGEAPPAKIDDAAAIKMAMALHAAGYTVQIGKMDATRTRIFFFQMQ